MLIQSRFLPTLGAVTLILSLSSFSTGANQSEQSYSQVRWSSNQVVFQSTVSVAAQTLTVSCDGGVYFQNEFQGTEMVSFSTFDKDGIAIADGQCNYQLYMHPADIDEGANVEPGNDKLMESIARIEQENTHVLTGSFKIVGGNIVGFDESEQE